MNGQQRARSNPRRGSRAKRPTPVDIWRTPPPLPDLEPIVLPPDAGALLRSLGDPPMTNGEAAGHYFNAVIERASGVAVALALSADLLAQPDPE